MTITSSPNKITKRRLTKLQMKNVSPASSSTSAFSRDDTLAENDDDDEMEVDKDTSGQGLDALIDNHEASVLQDTLSTLNVHLVEPIDEPPAAEPSTSSAPCTSTSTAPMDNQPTSSSIVIPESSQNPISPLPIRDPLIIEGPAEETPTLTAPSANIADNLAAPIVSDLTEAPINMNDPNVLRFFREREA